MGLRLRIGHCEKCKVVMKIITGLNEGLGVGCGILLDEGDCACVFHAIVWLINYF